MIQLLFFGQIWSKLLRMELLGKNPFILQGCVLWDQKVKSSKICVI